MPAVFWEWPILQMWNSQSAHKGSQPYFSFFLIWGQRPQEILRRVTRSKSFPPWNLLLAGSPLTAKRRFGERLGVGHIFNSVKKQLVWISFHSCLGLPSLQAHGGEDLSRGASSMKNLSSITMVLYACCFCGIVGFADWQRGASFYVVNSAWNLPEPLYGEPSSNDIFKLRLLVS